MKNLTIIILVTLGIIAFSCKKSDDNPSDPTPVENYTIKYSVVSTGNVLMDNITYLDIEGKEVILTGHGQLTESFEQPSNNFHGNIYIKGKIEDFGSCAYTMKVLDSNNEIVYIKENSTNTPGTNFIWSANYSDTESK